MSEQKWDGAERRANRRDILFDLINSVKEELAGKIDDLAAEQANAQRILRDHMESEGNLIDHLRNAFPEGDPAGHRAYHEAVIRRAMKRAEFWDKLRLELAKWGLVGFLGWAVYALWAALLKGPK